MDRREIFLISDFGEVLPHLDDVVRKVILDERVPYSTQLPKTISSGELKIPRLCLTEPPIQQNAFSMRSNNAHPRRTHQAASTTRPMLSGKKRKALPYEKLATCIVKPQIPCLPHKEKGGTIPETVSSADIAKHTKTNSDHLTDIEEVQDIVFQLEDTEDIPAKVRASKSNHGSISDSEKTCCCNCHYSTKLKDLPSDLETENPKTIVESDAISTAFKKDSPRYQTVQVDTEESSAIASPSSIPSPKSSCSIVTPPCGTSTSSPQCFSRESTTTSTALTQREAEFSTAVLFSSTHLGCSTPKVTSPKATGTRKHISNVPSDDIIKDSPTVTRSKYPIEIGTLGVKEMDSIIQQLVEAQKVYEVIPYTAQTVNGTALTTKNTDIEEGADIKKAFLKSFMLYFEKKVIETVQFAKRIPGFLDLPRDDQANLVKESRNESDLISGMKCFDIQSQSFTSIDGKFFKKEDLKTILSEETLKIYTEGAAKVAKLNASIEEAALLRAITITFSDRCKLQCREKVEDIQNRLMSCLLHVVYNGTLPGGKRIGQMFDFLLFCRNRTEIALQNFKQILIEENRYDESPIVQEVL